MRRDHKTPLLKGEEGAHAQHGRVRGYAAFDWSTDVAVSFCTVPNPSSSHAFGAGPSFSLREKVLEAA